MSELGEKGNIDPRLETRRFIFSPESLVLMKETREMFKDLQADFPELKALSFFGSRTLGREHGEKIETFEHPTLGSYEQKTLFSDLDLFFLYDEDEMDLLEEGDVYHTRNDAIIDRITNFSKVLGAKKIANRLNVIGEDISEAATKEALVDLKDQKNSWAVWKQQGFNLSNSIYRLVARFLLSVGDVKQLREEVIADLEKDEEGELYWSRLMEVLSEFERPEFDHHASEPTPTGLPKYKYPKTLAEARKYFLTEKQA